MNWSKQGHPTHFLLKPKHRALRLSGSRLEAEYGIDRLRLADVTSVLDAESERPFLNFRRSWLMKVYTVYV